MASSDTSSSNEDKSVEEKVSEQDQDAHSPVYLDDAAPTSLFSYFSSDSDEDKGPQSLFNITKPFHVPRKFRNNERSQNFTDSVMGENDENDSSTQKLVGNISTSNELQEHITVPNDLEECIGAQSVNHITDTEGKENAMPTLIESIEILSGTTDCLKDGRDFEENIIADKEENLHENHDDAECSLQATKVTKTLSQTELYYKQNEQLQIPPIPDMKETNKFLKNDAHVLDVKIEQQPQVASNESTLNTRDCNTSFIIMEHNVSVSSNTSFRPIPAPRRMRNKSEQLNQVELLHIEEMTEHRDVQSVQQSVTKDFSDATADNEPCYNETGRLEKEKIGEGIETDVSPHDDMFCQLSYSEESFVVIDEVHGAKDLNDVAYVCSSEGDGMSKILQGVLTTATNNKIDDYFQLSNDAFQRENDLSEPTKSHEEESEDENYELCKENVTIMPGIDVSCYQIFDESLVVIGKDSTIQKNYQGVSNDDSKTEFNRSVTFVCESNTANEAADASVVQLFKSKVSMFENMLTAEDDEPHKTEDMKPSHVIEAASVVIPSNKDDLKLNHQTEIIPEKNRELQFHSASPAEDVPKPTDDFSIYIPNISHSETHLDHSKELHVEATNEGSNDSQVSICDTTNVPELDSSRPPHVVPKSPYVHQRLNSIKAAQDIKQDKPPVLPHASHSASTEHFGRILKHSGYEEANQAHREEQTQIKKPMIPVTSDMTNYGHFHQYSGQPYQYPHQSQGCYYLDEYGQYQYTNSYYMCASPPDMGSNYSYPSSDTLYMSTPSIDAIPSPLEHNTAASIVKHAPVTSKQETKKLPITKTHAQVPHTVSAQKQGDGTRKVSAQKHRLENKSPQTKMKLAPINTSHEGSSKKSKIEHMSSQKPQELSKTTKIEQKQKHIKQTDKHIPAAKHETTTKDKQQSLEPKKQEVNEHYIYVKDINPTTNKETIVNFFEAGTDSGIIWDKVIFNYTKTCALLVLDSRPDMHKLRDKIDKKGIGGYKPEVYDVKQPSRIAVSGTIPLQNSEALGYYFETKKSDGGPIVGDVKESEDGSCFVIEFEDKQVVKSVCERHEPHVIDGNRLRVSPYYTCEAGSIWDSHLHSVHLPEQIVIPLTVGKIKFLKHDCCKALLSYFEDIHCSWSFTDNFITISCTLTPTVAGFKEHVKTWKADVQHYVDKYVKGNILEETLYIKHLTCKLSAENIEDKVWENIQQFLYSELAQELQGTVMLIDTYLKEVMFIGFTDSVKKHIVILTNKVNEVIKQLRKTKDTMLLHHLHMRLLQSLNVFDTLQNNIGDIKMSTTEKEVTIYGQPEDISEVKLKIHEALNCIMKSSEQLNLNFECIDFINKELIQQLNKLIQEAGLQKVEWEIVDNNLVVYSWKIGTDSESDYANTGGCNADVIEIFKSNVKQESDVIKGDDVEVLKSDEFIVYSQELRKKYKHQADFVVDLSNLKIIIFGMKDVVSVMKKEISKFIDDNRIRQNVVVMCEQIQQKFIAQFHPHFFAALESKLQNQCIQMQFEEKAVKIKGKREGIEKVTVALKELLDTFISVEHKIEKVAVKDVFSNEKDTGQIDNIERNTRCLIQISMETFKVAVPDPFSELQSGMMNPRKGKDHTSALIEKPKKPECFKAQNGLTIKLVRGVIGKQNAHVLVVVTSADLNMKSGKACSSLLQEGGDSLQDECKTVKPDGVKPGEIVVIHGGKLECKNVYLTTLEAWRDQDETLKVLQTVMKDCLNKASTDNNISIAFCAMGTGQLKYPADLVAGTMYQAAIDFDFENPKTTLKNVQFVCYDKDSLTIQAFEFEQQMRIDGGGVRPTYNLQCGSIVIQVAIENLAKQKVDGILCTTSESMDLTHGACSALVREGGASLQDQCKTKHNNHLSVGNVVEITPGQLHCKSLFLTVLPNYSLDGALDKLKTAITVTLDLAQAKSYTSLAMPALGAGNLRYPPNDVCQTMFDTVIRWIKDHQVSGTTIKSVRFILYAKDHALIQKFKDYVTNAQNRAPRSTRRESTKHTKAKKADTSFQIGSVNFEIIQGSILEQETEAIVSSVGSDFKFIGAVAQILNKKFPSLEDECVQKRLGDLNKYGVVSTEVQGLKAGYIIHVKYADNIPSWKAQMLKCLKEADTLRCKSVAFPVLGTGGGYKLYNCEEIAASLFDAIVEFVRLPTNTPVNCVKLVVYQQGMFRPIVDAIKKKACSMDTFENTGFIQRICQGASNWWSKFRTHGSIVTPAEKKEMMSQLSSLKVTIHSDSQANIDMCIKELEATLEKAYTHKTIADYKDMIKEMTDVEVDEMYANINEMVDLNIDRNAGIIIIKGPLKEVDKANDCLESQLLKLKRMLDEKASAAELYKLVQWSFEEITAMGMELKPYNQDINFKIEKAFKNNEKHFELLSEDNSKLIIDFDKLEEYPENDISDFVRVVRKDILKSVAMALPKNWVPMKDTETIRPVALAKDSQEYKDIEARFIHEVNTGQYANSPGIKFDKSKLKVSKIERIQNKTLYQLYNAKKKLMQEEKLTLPSGMELEKQLWHGTNPTAIDSIKMHGFNRSYCGLNGIWFGAGVYFAVDASYSVRGWLTGANPQPAATTPAASTPVIPTPAPTAVAKGSVFLAKVLTGQYCLGNKQMRFLPAVDPTKQLLYDSAVDNVANPMEFVIFHDTQAYPEYVLSFEA